MQQPCKVQRGGIGAPCPLPSCPPSPPPTIPEFPLAHPPFRFFALSHFLHHEFRRALLAPPRHSSSSEVTIPHLPPLTPPADSFATPSSKHLRTRTRTHVHTHAHVLARAGGWVTHTNTSIPNESACHTQSIICKDPPPGCHGNLGAGARGARRREERSKRRTWSEEEKEVRGNGGWKQTLLEICITTPRGGQRRWVGRREQGGN